MSKVNNEIVSGILNSTSIDDSVILKNNLVQNEVPASINDSNHIDYEEFLKTRRTPMVKAIKEYF